MLKLLPLFFILGINLAIAQHPIDSLESALANAKDEMKVKTLNELFKATLNSDPVRALAYAKEALTLAEEIDDPKGMAAAYNKRL